MLTDKQSLLFCGLWVGGMFVSGMLDILDNFLVLTILTIIFLAIIINLITVKSFKVKEEEKSEEIIVEE
ncbi:hypothetical protein BWZ22_11245 [Seonamhaeicola sp. S2-3]|uniref:hypothetical protein n=1 Tax=Seonamhaeicola sp. S2-3 TaxID=1936081 RepID=UPI000972BC8D|nr:hypothetical protein [Seonamhaeicola sp. S2-3]APY11775.1 hypothetical protein BWZ22_11245 [Seonamhaeicola sp. S2-3]